MLQRARIVDAFVREFQRARIVDAFVREVGDKGLSGVRVPAVCSLASVSTSVFDELFPPRIRLRSRCVLDRLGNRVRSR